MNWKTKPSLNVLYPLILVCLFLSTSIHAAGDKGTCDVSITQFACPLCGGINVTDCLECDGFTNTDMVNSLCFKRKIFTAKSEETTIYLWNDIVGFLVWFVAGGVATACGVGGGGIYVPLGMILLRFAPKPASGLSQCSIFGASLGGLLLNLKARHPKSDIRDKASTMTDEEYLSSGGKFYSRPRIDYDMALFLAPMEMAGAVLGVMIQKVLPNWLYLLIAGCILGFTAYKTFGKYKSASRKEKEAKAKVEQEAAAAKEAENANDANSDEKKVDDNLPVSVSISGEEETNDDVEKLNSIEKRRELLEIDSIQYPMSKLWALVVLWIGLVIITFMKGGKGVESLVGITCESPWYYVLIACQFLWTLGFAAFYGYKLLVRQKERDEVDYPFLSYDVIWDNQKLRFYSSFTFIAGVVAGLIGIGGGMVLGPLMLIMGIHPVVSSATTATMIVLTSSSVAVLFITSGFVPLDYAFFFFATCFSGAYIGKRYIDGYVKKSGKASILIFILATIIGLSTIGCFYLALSRLADNDWCLDGMKAFCDKSLSDRKSVV